VFLYNFLILCDDLVRGNFTVDIEWVVWRIWTLVVINGIVFDNYVILIIRTFETSSAVLHIVFSFIIVSQRAY